MLYELGRWAASLKPIFVGVEPGYAREQDVHIQMRLEKPKLKIVDTLDALTKQVTEWLHT